MRGVRNAVQLVHSWVCPIYMRLFSDILGEIHPLLYVCHKNGMRLNFRISLPPFLSKNRDGAMQKASLL